jgi:hypothetical protein
MQRLSAIIILLLGVSGCSTPQDSSFQAVSRDLRVLVTSTFPDAKIKARNRSFRASYKTIVMETAQDFNSRGEPVFTRGDSIWGDGFIIELTCEPIRLPDQSSSFTTRTFSNCIGGNGDLVLKSGQHRMKVWISYGYNEPKQIFQQIVASILSHARPDTTLIDQQK